MNAASRSEGERSRALITGLRGFTGRYVAAELQAAGYRVFGIDQGEETIGEGIFSADLCDRAAIADVVREVKPAVVAHLAAIAFVAHGDAEAMYRINILGSRNLLEALAACPTKPRCVLLASSANVYGNAEGEFLDEATPSAPANDYGVSKLAMEHMAALWQGQLPITVTRPFNYTGVGQHGNFLLPKIVSHFARGCTEIELGNLDVARDFSDVRDVAAMYRRLLEVAPSGETLNVCSSHVYTLAQVLEMMADIAGYRIKVNVNPAFVRANEVKRLSGSAARLTRLIGEMPRIKLAETLQWMYRAELSRT